MPDEKLHDVAWWRAILEFTREPGAWLLILFALFCWTWWKYGDRILEGLGRVLSANIGAREASVEASKAHAREAEARARTAEAEADNLRNSKIAELQENVARLEVRCDATERKAEEAAKHERDCLRAMGALQGELSAVQRVFKDREVEMADKAAALNAALVELRVMREERKLS